MHKVTQKHAEQRSARAKTSQKGREKSALTNPRDSLTKLVKNREKHRKREHDFDYGTHTKKGIQDLENVEIPKELNKSDQQLERQGLICQYLKDKLFQHIQNIVNNPEGKK